MASICGLVILPSGRRCWHVHSVNDREESYHAVRLNFKVTNNKAEYKAMLTRLAIVKASRGQEVKMKANSQVVVGQIIGSIWRRVKI